jgi:hypothetical protein
MNKEVVEAMENVYREIGDTDRATLLFDIRDYHMDVGEVGALAQEANVQRLALNHLAPKPRETCRQRGYSRTRLKNPIRVKYSLVKMGCRSLSRWSEDPE